MRRANILYACVRVLYFFERQHNKIGIVDIPFHVTAGKSDVLYALSIKAIYSRSQR